MMIVSCIAHYLDLINLRSSMSPAQIGAAASLMIEAHPHVQIDAVKRFFKLCTMGRFGEHYGSMDIPRLLRWYDAYVQDLFAIFEEESYNKHQDLKSDVYERSCTTEAIEMPDWIAKRHNLIHEKTEEDLQVEQIRKDVINKNMDLCTEPGGMERIEALIQDELIKHGIFIKV